MSTMSSSYEDYRDELNSYDPAYRSAVGRAANELRKWVHLLATDGERLSDRKLTEDEEILLQALADVMLDAAKDVFKHA